jgi:hypothetical protein
MSLVQDQASDPHRNGGRKDFKITIHVAVGAPTEEEKKEKRFWTKVA